MDPRSLYEVPSHYRLLFDQRSDDLEYYLDLSLRLRDELGHPLRVLELGAGCGRVSLPLARAGHTVVSVELSSTMLDEFRRSLSSEPATVQARLTLHHGDAGLYRDEHRFDLVLFPFNGFAHFYDLASQQQLFAMVTRQLEPTGLFAFDVWMPNVALLAGRVSESPWLRDRETGEPIRYTEKYDYEPTEQILTTVCTVRGIDSGTRVMQLRQRQFFPQETLTLITHLGMKLCWRTSRFVLPASPLLDGHGGWSTVADNIPAESPGHRGEMLAYIVCPARK